MATPFAAQEAQLAARYGGKLPGKKPWLQQRLKERKYFDSGDYALKQAGQSTDSDVGQQIATPQVLGAGTIDVQSSEPQAQVEESFSFAAAEQPASAAAPDELPPDQMAPFHPPPAPASSASRTSSGTSPASPVRKTSSVSLGPPSPIARSMSLAPRSAPVNVPPPPGHRASVAAASPGSSGSSLYGYEHSIPMGAQARVSTIPIHHAGSPHGRSSVSGSFSLPGQPPRGPAAGATPGEVIPEDEGRARSSSQLSRESFSAADADDTVME